MAIVGVLQNDVDPMVSVMKLEKAPTESYADIGGLDQQVQEIKVPLLLSLSHYTITSPLNLIHQTIHLFSIGN